MARTNRRSLRLLAPALILTALVVFPGARGCPPDPAEDDVVDAEPLAEPVEEPAVARQAPGEPVLEKPLPPAPTVVGTWYSESCGERTYGRELVFVEGGSYVRLDLVSPCPPGTLCIWSGIVHFTGGWRIEGDVVRLIEEVQVGSGGPVGFVSKPDELTFDPTGPKLTAHVAGEDCVYTPGVAREVSGILQAR